MKATFALFATIWVGIFLTTPINAQGKTWGPATTIVSGFDRDRALNDVFKELKAAKDQTTAKAIASQLWAIFLMTPDDETTEEMNQALRHAGGYNFEKSIVLLDQVIARHPNYTEAWNQRAIVHFCKANYSRALSDCEAALELEPRHLGCMAGMAQILIRHMKRYKAGRSVLNTALKLHPFLYERVLFKEIPETQ